MTEAELLAEMERQLGAAVEPTTKEKIRRYVAHVSESEKRPVKVAEVAATVKAPGGTVSSALVRLRDEGVLAGSCRLGFVAVVR